MPDQQIDYPWYGAAEGGSLHQGDLLADFEIIVPQTMDTGQGEPIPVHANAYDFVVMTQTCDIEQRKVDSLLLCPRWDLWEFVDNAKQRGENWGSAQREALRRGDLPGYHLLNEGSVAGLAVGLSIVDFHEVHTAPTELVKRFARQARTRLRLLPPYREHLAQAFARFFMRVGLPVDISAESLKKGRS